MIQRHLVNCFDLCAHQALYVFIDDATAKDHDERFFQRPAIALFVDDDEAVAMFGPPSRLSTWQSAHT